MTENKWHAQNATRNQPIDSRKMKELTAYAAT